MQAYVTVFEIREIILLLINNYATLYYSRMVVPKNTPLICPNKFSDAAKYCSIIAKDVVS